MSGYDKYLEYQFHHTGGFYTGLFKLIDHFEEGIAGTPFEPMYTFSEAEGKNPLRGTEYFSEVAAFRVRLEIEQFDQLPGAVLINSHGSIG